MRTYSAGFAAIAAALALGTSALATSSTSARRPALRLAQTAPLIVTGSHFRSRERVRVTAAISGLTSKRVVRASRRGAFSAVFSTGAGRCSMVRVVAVGNSGSKAQLKHLPGPACMPA